MLKPKTNLSPNTRVKKVFITSFWLFQNFYYTRTEDKDPSTLGLQPTSSPTAVLVYCPLVYSNPGHNNSLCWLIHSHPPFYLTRMHKVRKICYIQTFCSWQEKHVGLINKEKLPQWVQTRSTNKNKPHLPLICLQRPFIASKIYHGGCKCTRVLEDIEWKDMN